jgi:hypothetical protein
MLKFDDTKMGEMDCFVGQRDFAVWWRGPERALTVFFLLRSKEAILPPGNGEDSDE